MQIIGSPDELRAQGVIEVVVPDLGAVLTFYRRLGFTVERETPEFVTLRWESTFLFIAQNADATMAPRWASIRIVVADVDAIWARVTQLQLPVGSSIADRPYGLRDFTVKDPAGFEIRFAQIIERRHCRVLQSLGGRGHDAAVPGTRRRFVSVPPLGFRPARSTHHHGRTRSEGDSQRE